MSAHDSTPERAKSNTTVDLSRRAVACKGFRWMPGMLVSTGRFTGVVVCIDDGCPAFAWSDLDEEGLFDLDWHTRDSHERELPDLDDPATLGCIEHGILPEFYPGAFLWRGPRGWCYGAGAVSFIEPQPTKGGALVCALEAALKAAPRSS